MKTRTMRQTLSSGQFPDQPKKLTLKEYEWWKGASEARFKHLLQKRRKVERQNKKINRVHGHKRRGTGRKYARPNHKDRVKTTNGQSKPKENKARGRSRTKA